MEASLHYGGELGCQVKSSTNSEQDSSSFQEVKSRKQKKKERKAASKQKKKERTKKSTCDDRTENRVGNHPEPNTHRYEENGIRLFFGLYSVVVSPVF